MCEVCGSTIGHRSGCPAADYDPEVIGKCEECGGDILNNEEHFDLNSTDWDGGLFHFECFCDRYLVEGR